MLVQRMLNPHCSSLIGKPAASYPGGGNDATGIVGMKDDMRYETGEKSGARVFFMCMLCMRIVCMCECLIHTLDACRRRRLGTRRRSFALSSHSFGPTNVPSASAYTHAPSMRTPHTLTHSLTTHTTPQTHTTNTALHTGLRTTRREGPLMKGVPMACIASPPCTEPHGLFNVRSLILRRRDKTRL